MKNSSTARQRVWIILLLWMLAGCIPAHVPDNLDDTPGPPVIVKDDVYEGATFSAKIPADWRVITGEARAPQSVIFVAPDDKTLIRLMVGSIEVGDVSVENQRNEIYPITLADNTILTAVFSSPYSTWAKYWATFEQVRDSVNSR